MLRIHFDVLNVAFHMLNLLFRNIIEFSDIIFYTGTNRLDTAFMQKTCFKQAFISKNNAHEAEDHRRHDIRDI